MSRVDWANIKNSQWTCSEINGRVRLDNLHVGVIEIDNKYVVKEFKENHAPTYNFTTWVWRVMWYQNGKTTTKKFFGETAMYDAKRLYGDKVNEFVWASV
jgi:hypothetical protein